MRMLNPMAISVEMTAIFYSFGLDGAKDEKTKLKKVIPIPHSLSKKELSFQPYMI